MIVTSVYLNPDAMDGIMRMKTMLNLHEEKAFKYEHDNIDVAADVKWRHEVPVWHLQIKYTTVPYIWKTTPLLKKPKNDYKNKSIHNDSVQTSAKPLEGKK